MTNEIKYFVGNWKMFGDFSSFKIIYKINKFGKSSRKLFRKNKIVLCVPSTLIHFFKKKLKTKFISLGAQNCHYHQEYGSFTGSVNALMLKKSGAEYIILGHSIFVTSNAFAIVTYRRSAPYQGFVMLF